VGNVVRRGLECEGGGGLEEGLSWSISLRGLALLVRDQDARTRKEVGFL